MGNAASLYQGTAINTATPAELTLMLYNGAIKAQNIIWELQGTLDFKYPVAKDFDLVYKKIAQNLLMANLRKDIEKLNEALEDIRGLRDVWAQVMKAAKTA